jgi:hypothetical protein
MKGHRDLHFGRKRSRTREEWIASLRWNITDATDALKAALSMRNWNGVIKYAEQIKRLEAKLHRAEIGTGTHYPKRRREWRAASETYEQRQNRLRRQREGYRGLP